MNKFFNYYSLLCFGANSPSSFSYDPYIIAIKEMLVAELQQLVYYIQKLKELDVDMSIYTDKVIDFISVIIVNLDFNKESFFIIIKDLFENKNMLKKMYISACENTSAEIELLDETDFDYSSDDEILKTLNEYEKNIQTLKFQFDKEKKILYEIMINLILNACNSLIELKNYGKNLEELKNKVLELLNTPNIPSLKKEDWLAKIKEFSLCNYEIMTLLYKTIMEKYGPVVNKEVCCCEKKGKAILISGNRVQDAEKILNAVEGLNINVYTHHEMLYIHQYKKFDKYKNLAGHHQKMVNNFTLDFASFPGPIYISGSSVPKIDVIRGQIYTSDKYPAYGIGKIENEDFSPLIKYALDSKGFDADSVIDKINIGYSKEEINNKVSEIINLFGKGLVNHIYIIGINDRFNNQNNYIYDFYDLCPDDVYIISFAYDSDRVNFWRVNSFFDFSALYNILELFKLNKCDLLKKINTYLVDCNPSTISHIFNLLCFDVNKIFLGPCCPNIVNPLLTEGLKDIFNIQPLSDPAQDIKN